MKQPSPVSLFARGLFNAGTELARNMISFRTINGLWYSVYRYPISPVFRQVSTPREGKPLPGGGCMVFNACYGVALFGLESLPPFDTHRAARIYEQMISDDILTPDDVFVPGFVSDEDLLLAHSKEYISGLSDPRKTAEALELPFLNVFPSFAIKRIISAYRCITEGTILAAHLALSNGLAINLGGGLHHARPNRGGGFCLFADIPIAIRNLRKTRKKMKVLIVDLDVHQGDGNIACLAWDRNTYLFSMHQSEIYPFPKEVGDLDVEMFSGTQDDEYLSLLKKHLPTAFSEGKPDLVFYIAGADTLREDPLASVNLSMEGFIQRDQIVANESRKHGVPIVITLGGGYSKNAWRAQYESIKNLIE